MGNWNREDSFPPADAQAMHAKIREGLKQITSFGTNMAILYGGSVKAESAVELAACPDINGALVGGASLMHNLLSNCKSICSKQIIGSRNV